MPDTQSDYDQADKTSASKSSESSSYVAPLPRGKGVTPSERRLKKLCDNSFLSLWSHSGIYRDQGPAARGKSEASGKRGDGKEVCDLLVVFENHILIFSDKDCVFPNSGNLELDWQRWFRRAVLDSAKQIYGAERWIREHPDRLFLDKGCSHPFPYELPSPDRAIFHRIVVAHDSARRCRQELGGSGSLMLRPSLFGEQHLASFDEGGCPFIIGQIEPRKGFIHVLDDTSLDIVLKTLDTITDFVGYLSKKEQFVLSGKLLGAAGEEDLLSLYLKRVNENQEHDFVTPPDVGGVLIGEGEWEEFQTNPQRLLQIEANRISYAWDRLIENFCWHVFNGSQYFTTDFHLSENEKMFRFLAREPRTRRRMLAQALLDLIFQTPPTRRGTRVVRPSYAGDPFYVFLTLPHPPFVASVEEYRQVRLGLLEALCRVTKLKFPQAEDIIGIATESGRDSYGSEDVIYLDTREWTDEMEAEAMDLQQNLALLVNPAEFAFKVSEYPNPRVPSFPQRAIGKRYPPNRTCSCGSGKKYKKCCGALLPKT